jgi:oligopeptide transport system permease protein
MIKHLLKKILIIFCSLFLVATGTFFLMHSIPGDPFSQDQAIPEEILKSLYHHYHLDKPLHVQYIKYMKGLMVGDLGPSFKYQGRMALDIIKEGFPASCILGVEALLIALIAGILAGTIAAFKRGQMLDQAAMIGAVLGISVPSFILATLLQFIFSIKFDLLPVARWGTFSHTILPAISLSALPTAFIARLTRSNMVEVLQQDFITTAKSKGINSFQLAFRHVLRNSLLPVITYIGPLSASILTGSFVIEKIFGIPGLGQWFVLSVQNRDYTIVMALTIFYSAFLMGSVLVVDLLYCFIDPRIKIGGDSE